MAERELGFRKIAEKPLEATHESLQDPEYFKKISLGDIYGRTTLKPGTRLVTDIPYSKYSKLEWKDDKYRELTMLLREKYDIPHIACYSSEWRHGQDKNGRWGNQVKNPKLVISVGMGAAMTNWAPFVAERGAITALATSISGTEKPVVLDVGTGNGFTSKLLAQDGNTRVIGVDPNLSRYEQLPDTSGDVSFREADIFELIEEFGPNRFSQDTERIKEILEKIKGSFMEDKNMYFWGMQHGFFRGMGYKDFSNEVKKLRKIAGRNREQSPVDLAICSFMTVGDDLTLAIRDGIRPKAIAYAMPVNGFSGVGNFYLEDEKKKGIENKVVSFNPGKEYRTVACWQTFWQDDWGRYCYEQGLGLEQALVVVQLRKDIKPKLQKEIPVVRTYPFDMEIAEVIRTGKRWEKFDTDYYKGIMGKVKLLEPRIDLPYKTLGSGT